MRIGRVAVTGLLALFTYGTFLRNYAVTPVDPGLFGFAPHFLLSTVVGVLFAVETDRRVADSHQALRLTWYPAWALAASLPLYAVLAFRGVPAVRYWTYHLVLGGIAGVAREAGGERGEPSRGTDGYHRP